MTRTQGRILIALIGMLVLVAGGVLAAVLTRSPGSSPTPKASAMDVGVAECRPFERLVVTNQVDINSLGIAEAIFDRSQFADMRSDADQVTSAYESFFDDAGTLNDVDEAITQLWTTCAEHGVKVAPGI